MRASKAEEAKPARGPRRRPPAAPTVMRTIRVPAELWEAAQDRAYDEGTSVSEVVRQGLERYVKRRPRV